MKKEKKHLLTGLVLLAAFVLWTILIQVVDVQPMGQNGTEIGFASFNVWFHGLTGVHMALYTLTDWLELLAVLTCLCFGLLGVVQAVKRRSVLRVDPDLILLGVYYVIVFCCFVFFNMVPINYRPILIDGVLEPSYPSSTTLLVLSVMPTLKYQIDRRSGSIPVRRAVTVFVVVFSAFIVVGRLLSGVHWATDIIGSVLLSGGLFMLYQGGVELTEGRRE